MTEKTIETDILHKVNTETPPINNGKVTNGGFIVGRYYDSIWFIGAPTIALVFAFLFVHSSRANTLIFEGAEKEQKFADLLLGTVIMSHLFIVFFRSHGNPKIFALHPIRFIVVPTILIACISYNLWAVVIISVIATWWDVYHSGLQTFGLGRIYDMRAGNDPRVGRRLDYLLNSLLYLGPILAGVSLMDHVNDFEEFTKVGATSISSDLVIFIFNQSNTLQNTVVSIGIPFILYYIYSYWQLYKRGYVFSLSKVILLTTTSIVSIFCWGFNTFGEAFFVMNFFHAWQYFAIVWAFEKKSITSLFMLSGVKFGQLIAFFLFVFIAFTYGYWVTQSLAEGHFVYALILTVSILHFWYDGFIWSVKKKQV